jgi:hypothetical protein
MLRFEVGEPGDGLVALGEPLLQRVDLVLESCDLRNPQVGDFTGPAQGLQFAASRAAGHQVTP